MFHGSSFLFYPSGLYPKTSFPDFDLQDIKFYRILPPKHQALPNLTYINSFYPKEVYAELIEYSF